MGLWTSVCCWMRIAWDYVTQKCCSVAASRTGPLGACPDIPSEAAPWSLAIHSPHAALSYCPCPCLQPRVHHLLPTEQGHVSDAQISHRGGDAWS